VALGLSVLIGVGMAALPTVRYGVRRWLALIYAMLVSGGTFGFGLFWQLLGHSAVSEGHYLLIAGVTVLLAMALVVLFLLPGWNQRRSILVVGLVVGNLFWANFTTNLDQFSPARKTILAPEMEALATAVKAAGSDATGLPGRVYNEFRIYEDYGMRQKIEDGWGSSPLRLARYAALFDNFPLDRLWQLTGVTHLLTWRRELFEPSTLVAEFPQTTDTTYLHHLVDPNPRAWLVHKMQPATDETALSLLADHAFDLGAIGLLPTATLATPLTLPTGSGTVQVDQRGAGHLGVGVKSENGGLLILSENWMPGWQVRNAECAPKGLPRNAECEADEFTNTGLQSLTVYRADLALIGVVVPAGVVSFELVYWPRSVQLGLGISGGTMLLLVVLGGWRLWVRRGKAGR
jgi:hypothetical protein